MRNFVISLLPVFFSISSLCQANETLTKQDSVCLKKSASMLRQLKASGPDAKYYFDNGFLAVFIPPKAQGEKCLIRLLNLTEDKTVSLSIYDLSLETKDSTGNPTLVTRNTSMELIKDYSMPRCGSCAIDIPKVPLPGGQLAELKDFKIKVLYADKEIRSI